MLLHKRVNAVLKIADNNKDFRHNLIFLNSLFILGKFK